MNSNLINEWAVQIDSKTKDYKTLTGAQNAYNKSKLEFVSGEVVRLIQYTDITNNVIEIECNM